MALTAYCKKCRREVAPGDLCPRCGTRLAKTAVHAAWVTEKRPVGDWMSWNAVFRWLFPAGLVILLLSLLLEALSGGLAAVEALFLGSFPLTLGLILFSVLALVFLALLLQGKELTDYVIDSRGVHASRYLPSPTALKLLARLKSPRLLSQVDPESENPVLLLEERDLPWRAVSRVQLWPEKCYILFYAPAWWLQIPVRCTPFSWDDALFFVRDKLGKKKSVDLPDHLRVQAAKVPSSRKRKAEPASSSPVSVYIPPRDEEPAPIGSEPESAYPPQESREDAFSESEGQLRMDLDPDPDAAP